MVKEQMADLAKVVPVLGIFLLPGGGLLLPIAARILPFDLFPSAFCTKKSPEFEEEVGTSMVHFYALENTGARAGAVACAEERVATAANSTGEPRLWEWYSGRHQQPLCEGTEEGVPPD